MLIPKKVRKTIYSNLFKDGVLVAKKDTFAPRHMELDVPNLMVIKALQSLKSRGYVTEAFCFRHFYFFLTNEGVDYLREYLHLPAEVVPETLKKKAVTEGKRFGGSAEGGNREQSDRTAYRGPPTNVFGGEKKTGSDEFRPAFRGGFGRGDGERSGGFGRGDGERSGGFGGRGGFGRGRGRAPESQ